MIAIGGLAALLVEIGRMLAGAWCWWRHKGQHRVLAASVSRGVMVVECRQCWRRLVKPMDLAERAAYFEAAVDEERYR